MISPALILASFWVLAAAVTAMLPMRYQYAPGLTLLILSLPLLIFVGSSHGWVWVVAVLAAVISMYRNPLRYFARQLTERIR